MSKHENVRLFLIAAFLGALTLGGVPAWADEPPPEDFPPPPAPEDMPAPERSKTPPAPLPPAATPAPSKPAPKQPETNKPATSKPATTKPATKPASAGAWSPPAVTPGGAGSALPPPQIIRRRGSQVATTALPPRTARPEAPIVDMPTTRRPPPPPPPPKAASSGLPTVRPPAVLPREGRRPVVRTPATPIAPRAYPTALTSTRVFGVAKTHNVPLTDGDLALQLDIDYEVHGQDGRNVYVGIWFVRTDTGRHIRSALTTYGDADGFVTLQTRTALVRGNAGRFTATLKIPYRAFPVAQSDESYEVEARVQILRADGAGRATSLARGNTTFRVYGLSEADARATGQGAR